MMAIHTGCSEDQILGVVVDGIDRATTRSSLWLESGDASEW
jgi:hypothetical protein